MKMSKKLQCVQTVEIHSDTPLSFTFNMTKEDLIKELKETQVVEITGVCFDTIEGIEKSGAEWR